MLCISICSVIWFERTDAHPVTHSFLVSCGPTTCIWITATYDMMGKWLSNTNTHRLRCLLAKWKACVHESCLLWNAGDLLTIIHFHIVGANMISCLSVNVESTGMSLPSPSRSRFSLFLFSLRFLLFLFQDSFRFETKVNRLEDSSWLDTSIRTLRMIHHGNELGFRMS